MPARKTAMEGESLVAFACPNSDCDLFNHFDAGNLSVVERMGKNKSIRRLYCNHCRQRFSELQGSLMEYTKLPEEKVVRILKCMVHGCSVEAVADICEVDPRTAQRIMERGGRRSEIFHRRQLQRIQHTPRVVEMDELHARVCPADKPAKKGARPQRPN